MPDKVRLKNTNSGFLVREVAELGDKTGVEDLLNQFNRYQEKKKKREGISEPLAYEVGSWIRKGIQKGIGRVATNLITPFGYNNKIDELLDVMKRYGIKKSIQAVIDDKPVYYDPKTEDKDWVSLYAARDLPYRKMFGLEPRYGKGNYVKNSDGSYSLSGSLKKELANNIKYFFPSAKSVSKELTDKVMGSYTPYHTGDSVYTYRDKWDVGLNKGETSEATTGTIGFLRRFIDTITDPVTIKGQIDLRKKK